MSDGMKTIKWYLSIGLVGCRLTGSFEIEDDAGDAEVDEAIREAVLERIEWGQAES